MDRSFGSPLGKSPFSPRARQNLTTKRILPQSFRKSSRFSVSGKSTQSVQIILSTPHNFIERFGQPLPVLITEALTFSDRNAVVSARISKNGYAWVVCGRRLLIWQFRQSPNFSESTPHKKSSLLNQCFELQLPQSDLAHRAELVSVLINNQNNTPSCITVSPEGVVRYWPAIVHEGVSVEQHVNLQGQECDSLTDVEGLGCILTTTTCTVVLIQPHLLSGRHTLKCKTLKTPTGWLGGISKRMSSLIFGPIATEHSAETRMIRILSVQCQEYWSVYVLADHSLQKWHLHKNDNEELIFVAELNRMIRDNFRNHIWENSIGDHNEIDTWLLDIQADKDNVIILAAAVNISVSPRVHYAMICLQTSTNQAPANIKDFLLLKVTDLYTEDNSNGALSYRMLLSGTYAYLYNHRCVIVIKPHEDSDTLEFSADYLLAGSICVNSPIFFSRNHGLVSVSSHDMANDFNLSLTSPNTPVDTSLLNETSLVNNLSIYNMDGEEVANSHKDTLNQLKAAFIFYVKKQEREYKDIIDDIFPNDVAKLCGIDSLLDKITLQLSRDLLDDIPAGDPRWNQDIPMGVGSSYSMQVIHQLEDKLRAHNLFIKFLKDAQLWQQLGASTIRNTTISTVYILSEFHEKLAAAIALKSLPLTKAIERAIEKVALESEVEPQNGLTCQDICYREVSKIHRVIQEIVNYCEDVSHSNLEPARVVNVVNESNSAILFTLKEILRSRQANCENYRPSESVLKITPDFLPWTAANGAEGLADSLAQMHFLTYNYGVILTNNERLKAELLNQLMELTDIILDGRKSHLESIKATAMEEILFKQYSADRQKFMKPLIQEKDWEKAAKLAEKYLDFETLVIICEATDNQRLDEYIERFGNCGFSEFVYNWYLKESKHAKLINKCRTNAKSKEIQTLTNFLADYPQLSWLQNIFNKKYSEAAEILEKLALNESDSITRQKTMLSLSKLSKLAAPKSHDTDNFVKNISARLDLIAFQEEIPDYVLQQFGYDTVNIRVISPKDLICLYTCKEYKEAGELEFKKALDLLCFITDEDLKQELALKIWRNALLRDSWDHSNLDSPLDLLQNKLFFRVIDLALILNEDALNLLPPLDALLADECMDELRNNMNFQFLLKTGYEHVYRSHTIT